MGQSVGTAAFGGILNAYLAPYLAGVSGKGDPVSRIMSPELRHSLPAAEFASLVHAMDGALHTVFYILVGFAVVVLVAGLLLPRGRGLIRKA